MPRSSRTLSRAAERLLFALAAGQVPQGAVRGPVSLRSLLAQDLVAPGAQGVSVTAAGRAWLVRRAAAGAGVLDPFLAQHLEPEIVDSSPAPVMIDRAESPLAWLARRKGKDGQPLISHEQLLAGERLRIEFTRAQMMPRVTSDWNAAGSPRRRGSRAETEAADSVVGARQRVRHAVDAVGPEFAGLLLDVCCFLKRLEDIERERRWPARSAKVVLQLGLDRLARHYGIEREARGRPRAPMRGWVAPDIGRQTGAE